MRLCSFCGSALALTTDDAGITCLMYRMEIDSVAVESVAKMVRHLPQSPRSCVHPAHITEIFPMYLPFWRLVGTGKAIACGYSTSTDKDGHSHHHAL